jgi:hypothetical protein
MMDTPTNVRRAGMDGDFSFMRVPEALTNWRALVGLGVGVLLASLLFALSIRLSMTYDWLSDTVSLLALAFLLCGVNAAGIALSDAVYERPARTILSYVIAGVLCLPRLIGMLLVLLVAAVLVMLAILLVMWIGQIPGLGAAWLVVAVPAALWALMGLLLGAYIMIAVAGPAIWNGERLTHSIFIAWRILRHDAWRALMKLLICLLMATVVGSIAFGLFASASLSLASLALAVWSGSIDSDLFSLRTLFSFEFSRGLEASVQGAMIGYVLAASAVVAATLLPFFMAGILVWGEFAQKFDLELIRREANEAVNKTQQRLQELKAAAESVAEQARAKTASEASSTTAADQPPRPLSLVAQDLSKTAKMGAKEPNDPSITQPSLEYGQQRCRQCGAEVAVEDSFCGHCGNPLKGH